MRAVIRTHFSALFALFIATGLVGCPPTDDFKIVDGNAASGGSVATGGTNATGASAGTSASGGIPSTGGAANGGESGSTAGTTNGGSPGTSGTAGSTLSSGGTAGGSGSSSGGSSGAAGSAGSTGSSHCLANWQASTCDKCTKETQADRKLCRDVLQCYIDNNCSPTTCSGNDGLCGMNKFGGGAAPIQIAKDVYECMCITK